MKCRQPGWDDAKEEVSMYIASRSLPMGRSTAYDGDLANNAKPTSALNVKAHSSSEFIISDIRTLEYVPL